MVGRIGGSHFNLLEMIQKKSPGNRVLSSAGQFACGSGETEEGGYGFKARRHEGVVTASAAVPAPTACLRPVRMAFPGLAVLTIVASGVGIALMGTIVLPSVRTPADSPASRRLAWDR